MERIPLSTPEIALIAGTRAVAGVGLGMLLADKLNDDQRKAVGWSLLLVGALTTVPIALQLFGSKRAADQIESDDESLHHAGAGL